jgi:hypothetical protein
MHDKKNGNRPPFSSLPSRHIIRMMPEQTKVPFTLHYARPPKRILFSPVFVALLLLAGTLSFIASSWAANRVAAHRANRQPCAGRMGGLGSPLLVLQESKP